MTEAKPVAGYYRISVSREEMNAPEIYEGEIERYCSYKGLTLAATFSDIDYSGYNRSESRPALNELVARRQEFSAVVVPKLSRFGRSLKHLTQLFDTFDSDGIALVFLDLGLDTSTSQGRLLRNIMAAFSEYESAVRGDYTRANARHAIENGRPFGGKAPYGYAYDKANKTNRVHEEHADAVRFMFRRYDEGASQFAIARELAQRGIATPRGKPTWEANKVGRLLDNPAYASLMPLDGELVPGNWEALVDAGVWERVARRRKETREKWSRPRSARRLLAGLIYCEDCGRKMYYTARSGGLPGRYRCSRSDVVEVCDAPGINAPRTEERVTREYLRRSRYQLMQGDGATFIGERQWKLADDQEKRMLLAAAIARVVIVPLPGPHRRRGGVGSSVRIEWKEEPTPVEPVPKPKRTKGMSRGHVLARRQREEIKAKKAQRSQRAKRYAQEWKAFREAHRV